MTEIADLWVYLSRDPLAALAATICAWWLALQVQAKARAHPLANPVLLAVVLLAGALLAAGIDYRAYFEGAQFVHFLLGPATVALAVPLARQWREVRADAGAITASVAAGSATAVRPVYESNTLGNEVVRRGVGKTTVNPSSALKAAAVRRRQFQRKTNSSR